MARCEDYPCCGHTDGLPCDWTQGDLSSDPHLLCDHENGFCEAYADDPDDYNDEPYTPEELLRMEQDF